MRKAIRYVFRFFLVVFLLLGILIVAIQLPWVQNRLVQMVSTNLSRNMGTEVSVGNVSIDFLSRIHINDVLIKDYKKDTLLFAGSISNKHILDFSINRPFHFLGQRLKIEDVKFYLDNTRSDSSFNLTHTFRKKSKDTVSASPKKAKTVNLDFLRFGVLELENVDFRLKDQYNYQTISLHLEDLKLDAKRWRFADSVWQFGDLNLSKPSFTLVHHKAPITPKSYKPEYLTLPFQAHLDHLKLEHAKIRVIHEDGPLAKKGFLAFTDLDVRNLFLNATQVELRKHTIQGNVTSMRAIEKSGLGITELKAQFFMNSFKTEAKNLYFKTNHSKLQGDLSFRYNHMREYLRFAAWVKVYATMKESNLSLKDLAYFSPALQPWSHLNVRFDTKASGTMNGLTLANLSASLNENKIKVKGEMKVLDLFSGKGLHTIAQLHKFSFNKNDIEFIFQKKGLPQEIVQLGTITYDGQFRGNPVKFTLNGRVNSAKGNALLSETSFDFTNSKSPQYKGHVQLENIELQNIITGGSPIDRLSASVYVDGRGFDIEHLNSYVKGSVSKVYINSKLYTNFLVDGNIEDKVFNGEIVSQDPSLKLSANGKVSMKEEIPKLELNVKLDNVDLQKLGYTKDKLLLNANIYGIGRGRNIDEMLGSMTVRDMYVNDIGREFMRYEYSNLTIEKDVFEESGNKYIQINSDEIKASLIGKYRVADIPRLLKDYFISYLAINKNQLDNASYSTTYFNLQIDVKNLKNYALILHPSLKDVKQGTIQARFNGKENKMEVTSDLKHIEYLNFQFSNLALNGSSTNSDFKAEMKVDSVYFQNKLAITPLVTNIRQAEDGLNLSLELLNKSDDKFVDFNCSIRKDRDDYLFHIKPFTSYFGRKVWSINPDNLIRFNDVKKEVEFRELELLKDIQTIKIANDNKDFTKLDVLFEEVKLEELISGFLPILKTFKGNLNGRLQVSDILTQPKPVANLNIRNMLWDNEKLGDLILASRLQDDLILSNVSIFGDYYKLNSEIMYDTKVGADSLYSMHHLERFRPQVLNKILSTLVYEMHGNLSGDFEIYGAVNKLRAKGQIQVDSLHTGLHTIYTKYHTKNQKIIIHPDRFVFDNFKFYDEENNPAIASGFINYNHLKKFDLFLDANSSKLLCMNSNQNNNSTVYGKVYADAEVKFRGTIGQRISIISKGRNLPNSTLYISLESNQKIAKYGFYDFINKDSSNAKQAILSSANKMQSGVNLDFDFDVNKDGKLYIIMDPSSEDRIECNGQGRIVFKLSPEADMDIKGSYEIYSGTYLFTYQNLVQRLFYLNQGGSLTFVGDPYNTAIDASATFTTRASAQDLITSFFGNTDNSRILSAAKTNVKANIILKLKNKMMQPDISYELKVEQNNPDVQSAFDAIETTTKNNEAELNKQVVGLLMLQRFFPPSFNGFANNQTANNTVSSDFQNTAFSVVTDKLSGYVTDWMQNTFKGMNFGLSYKNYSQLNQSDNLTNTRNEFKVAISQKLLNDRLIFNVGGNYDFGRGQFNNANTNTAFFGGDMDIEYLLTEEGNIRAKAYSTLSNDPLNSVYINKTGAGILFQKDFDRFSDFFKKRKFK